MRTSSWVKLIVKSAVGAGIIAAAELGVAFALRVIDWSVMPASETTMGRTAVWVVFIFATAVLGGVAVARHGVRLIRAAIAHRRALAAATRATVKGPIRVARVRAVDAARGTAAVLARIGAAAAAAIGAGAAFALIWIPMYTTGVPGRQIRVLALAAAAGLALGLVMAVLALYAAPVAVSAAATAGWVWAFGLASVWLATARGETATPMPPRLAMLDAPHLIGRGEWWLGPNLMVAIAALLGAAVAATARWVGSRPLTVAICGAAGPVMVATGYVVVGPVADLAPAYVASLLAVGAGLVASIATAAVRRRSAAQRPVPVSPEVPALIPAHLPAQLPAQPTRAALPAGPATVPAAIGPAAAGPSRVTLEAEYAATQPNRGAVPVFEVTTMPDPTPAARPVSPAVGRPVRIPDPVPMPSAPPRPPVHQPRVHPPTKVPAATAGPAPAPARAPAPAKKRAKPQAQAQVPAEASRTSGAADKPGRDGKAKNARPVKQRGRSTRQSRQEKREREHVDWVTNLVNLPTDPSLDLRPRP